MTIPQTIPFSSISLGDRARTTYNGIPELAESLEHNGLIQPIVLGQPYEAPAGPDVMDGITDIYPLLAGGRRYHALQLLGVTELHHGVTSEPNRYGFLLKGEAPSELSNVLTELAENLDRHDMPWQDEVALIVKAAKLIKRDAAEHQRRIVMRDLGIMLGVPYNDYQAAEAVYSDLVANPSDYKECTTVRNAYAVLLKKNQRYLESLAVKQSLLPNKVQGEPQPEALDVTDTPGDNYKCSAGVDPLPEASPITVSLTSHFSNTNGITLLEDSNDSFDHIICDPDFAVSKERLAAGTSGAAEGVAQDSIETSLTDLEQFIRASYFALRPKGFLIFFYDLDHHEKVQGWATGVGFSVQRWPIIWHKIDYRSNAAPAANFCKNMEYALIAHKPGGTLNSARMSSILSYPSEGAVKEFGHPFAKPRALWRDLMSAVTLRGQSIFDPFMGSASSTVTAIDMGLEAFGAEVQEKHYNTGILNIQKQYRKMLGEGVRFE